MSCFTQNIFTNQETPEAHVVRLPLSIVPLPLRFAPYFTKYYPRVAPISQSVVDMILMALKVEHFGQRQHGVVGIVENKEVAYIIPSDVYDE